MTLPIILPRNDAETAQLLAWAAARLDDVTGFTPGAFAIGVARRNALAAVCVYHTLQPPNLCVGFAADDPRWATRQVISFLIAWPFIELPQVQRLSCIVRRRNKRSRKLCEGVGWRIEGTHADWFTSPRDAGISYAITRRWWQGWESPDGKECGNRRWYVPQVEAREAA